MKNPFLPAAPFADLFARHGHKFFDSGAFNLNIFGIRGANPGSNQFDDLLCLFYMDEQGIWQLRCWKATTDPGTYWLQNPGNPHGTALLVPGQYRGVYAIDKHNGQYEALCQRKGEVSVYRDNNKDDKVDLIPESIQKGWFGINIHRSNPYSASNLVNRWSAGCQVFANPDDFSEFMTIVRKSANMYGNSFTYTLFTEDQL